MMKRVLLLTMMCFSAFIGRVEAVVCLRNYYNDPNGLATATGIVQGTGRNSIEIFDEEQKRLARFIDVGEAEQFHQGDYIRIYYHRHGGIVVKIMRMTVLEYKENVQNLGNIFKR